MANKSSKKAEKTSEKPTNKVTNNTTQVYNPAKYPIMNPNLVSSMSSAQANNVKMPAKVPDKALPAPDFEKMKEKLEDFKKKVVKKYAFTIALGILPPNASPLFEEEENVPKEVADTRPVHLMLIIPEEQYNNIPKIKPELLKMIKETGENFWLHIKTPVDLWNYGLDSKFEFMDAISASFPVFDNGFLGALRVANIHKTLLLRKFEKYVTTYVIGGSLVRGTAGKDSDVDVFVVIDDTDVKRMSRMELLDKLKNIIYDYIREATALAGVKNILSPQIYLLTDFWQSVKDVHPVIFTFIRDGIPLYDRGTFIPWKMLLKMGKIKPSPEAIDLYMKQGDQTKEIVDRRLIDAMIDVYYGVLTPTQALMMLAGEAPPTHKEAPQVFREAFYEKEKLIEEKYVKILEKAVRLFKEYEHGKLKTISGKEIDVLMEEWADYTERMKKLRKVIEKKLYEKTAEEIYEGVFKLLKTLFGNKSQEVLVKDFEEKLVKKGKVESRFLKIVKELAELKKKIKSGKLNLKEVDKVKKDSIEIINSLTEFAQRSDLVCTEKGTIIQITYGGNRKAELVLTGKDNFLVEGRDVKKIEANKLVVSKREALEKALSESKGKMSTKVTGEIFAVLEKELGKFELII